mgnify:CR=1 FL=1
MKITTLITLFLLCMCLCASAEVIQRDIEGVPYYLYIPSKYNSSQEYPLIVALHWSTAIGMDMLERWREPAEKLSYIVACPNSHNSNYWDIKEEDGRILRMIEQIEKDYSVDKKRVLVTGFSAGGTYAYYLGIVYPEIFAASAPLAGSLKWLISENGLKLSMVKKKTPIYAIYGAKDITVGIEEGRFAQDELRKYGFQITLKEISGLDHQYPPFLNWPIIKWFEKLEKQKD